MQFYRICHGLIVGVLDSGRAVQFRVLAGVIDSCLFGKDSSSVSLHTGIFMGTGEFSGQPDKNPGGLLAMD